MDFVHFKKYPLLFPLIVLFLGFQPSTIISEPRYKPTDTPLPPITILYSGVTKFDIGDALLLRINSTDSDEIVSVCSDERIIIEKTTNSATLQWKPGENCTIPLITYKGKNYILPLNQKSISLDVLSDISTETLKNTIAITTLLNTDTKLSTLKTRKIIRNINSILEARDTAFLLPVVGIKLPEKDTHLPNSPRPFRADVTDGIHHGWDFYVNQGTPVRAVEE